MPYPKPHNDEEMRRMKPKSEMMMPNMPMNPAPNGGMPMDITNVPMPETLKPKPKK